ncbi:hypothetical protein KPL71_006847 [Citrus sinensis]|uniref:Uncharacterized protein n=1 Tax=Citrus sinensis TaxID=2711 RepID=A0ACB8LTZ8_CITSI|nr:hypothetical protein KPL71_006847 [Citrus sinensis]
MVSNIDLRFTVPPMLSLFLLVLNSSNETFLFPVLNIAATDHEHSPLFTAVAMLFLAILTLFFLLTSLKIPLNVSLEALPIRLRFGDFSCTLALSVLASLLLPTPLFCIAYFVCICFSPWFHALVNTLRRFCRWFFQLLQSIPTFVVVVAARSTLRSQDTVEAEPSSTTLSVEEADPPPSEIVPV